MSRLTQERREALARELRLPVSVLDALDIGWWPDRRCWDTEQEEYVGDPGAWTFPECDADGHVIGIDCRFTFRDADGRAVRNHFGKRGLTLPRGWREFKDAILLVEGPSDVLAAVAIGVNAIGRFSNTGGASLLAKVCEGRRVIVAGENDQHDGRWPGREGAEAIQKKLQQAWGRPVHAAFPPKGIKDLRDWVTQGFKKGSWFKDSKSVTAKRKEILKAVEEPPVMLIAKPSTRRNGKPTIEAWRPAEAQPLHAHQFHPANEHDRSKFAEAVARSTNAAAEKVEAMLLGLEVPIVEPRAAKATGVEQYDETDGGIIWNKPIEHGFVPVSLTNFTARIVGQIERDDGADVRRDFELEATRCGRSFSFRIPAASFTTMSWPVEHMGASAVVFPGLGTRDHARAAIQLLSGDPPNQTIYQHIGWRKLDGQWVYLHAGGAVGSDGSVTGVVVDVPELNNFTLPAPTATGAELEAAVRASLRILTIAPLPLVMPLWACIWRAPAGNTDFSVTLIGGTGVFKSCVAAIVQAHWGSKFDYLNLPGSWSSTANSIEALTFGAKDAVFTIDDYAPGGSPLEIAKMNRDAARVFRAQGNHSARGRLWADGTPRPSKPPRGLIVSTGEDLPTGQSIRARMLTIEVGEGDINTQVLTTCQEDARNGLYATALAGYLRWMAARYDQIQEQRRARIEVLRAEESAAVDTAHKRSPAIIAELRWGIELFIQFAKDVGVFNEFEDREADDLYQRACNALRSIGSRQKHHVQAEDPVRRFLELLSAALVAGDGHLTDTEGHQPANPGRWGWRDSGSALKDGSRIEDWRPMGDRIGWLRDDRALLNPDVAFKTAQSMGSGVPITAQVLWARLKERGLSICESGRYQSRVTLGDERKWVINISAAALSVGAEEVIHVIQPIQDSPSTVGPTLRDGSDGSDGSPDAPHGSGSAEIVNTPSQSEGEEVFIL